MTDLVAPDTKLDRVVALKAPEAICGAELVLRRDLSGQASKP